MVFDYILYAVGLAGLLVGSYTDLKTREVPDWVSFAMIFSGLGLRLIYSLLDFNWSIFFEGLIGFLIFVAIAYMMYYLGQWGGGDAKLLMGLGALIGLPFSFEALPNLVLFFVNLLVVGAVYGLIWVIALAVIQRQKFWPEVKKQFQEMKTFLIALAVISLIPFAAAFFYTDFLRILLLLVGFLPLGSFVSWLLVKSVEEVAFYKNVSPENLTVGDWIARDVFVDGERICGPKDLGIEKEQINRLVKLKQKGKIKKILIKEGIPFIPSFLIAFAVLYFGNWIIYLV